MSKQTEALKLALEALEHCKDVIIERGLNGNPEFAKKWGLALPLERSKKAITAVRKALADESSGTEQPAQQPDMNLNCKSVQARLATSWGYAKAEQQEPVARKESSSDSWDDRYGTGGSYGVGGCYGVGGGFTDGDPNDGY